MPILKDLLRSYREQRGLTQEELAARVEPPVSADTIGNLERGRTQPYRHTLETVCDALGLDEAQRQEVWTAWRSARGAPTADTPTTRHSELLIGREQELQALDRRLARSDVRVLTLTGPGGVGKTHLALALMERVAERFRGGVRFVDLSPLTEPRRLLFTIARAVGCLDVDGQAVAPRLVDALRDQQLLLVLDNFEHLLDAAADVAPLLSGCPAVKVLATSREPLRLSREHLYVVPTLRVPNPDELRSLDAVRASPAVALFLERAQAADERFAIDEANAESIGTLCAKLDGLPLALELAAARVRTLTPAILLTHLNRRLDLLMGTRDAPHRQQSLRATLSWSYELLEDSTRLLFRRTGVFGGAFMLDVAEAVCSGPALNVLPGLLSLVDKNLLLRVESGGSGPCFRLLETMRAYALEQLRTHDEYEIIAQRHAEYMLALAEEAVSAMDGSEQAVWMDRLEAVHDDLRAGLNWFVDSGHQQAGLRLAIALESFWGTRGHVTEGRDWLAALLSDVGPEVARSVHARALNAAGMLVAKHHEYAEARGLHLAALDLARAADDVPSIARALRRLGDLADHLGDRTARAAYFGEALATCRAHGLRTDLAWTLLETGEASLIEFDLDTSGAALHESLDLFEQAGDRRGAARVQFALGQLAFGLGDDEASAAWLERSQTNFIEVNDGEWVAAAGLYLGLVHVRRGRHDQARAVLLESLIVAGDVRDEHGTAQLLEGVACLAIELGELDRGRRLLATAARTRARLNLPIEEWEQRWLESWLARARAVGPVGGHDMGVDEAVRYALDWRDSAIVRARHG
jgi:predicted ATPase/DNA-binding XRE family transcriptional regulator